MNFVGFCRCSRHGSTCWLPEFLKISCLTIEIIRAFMSVGGCIFLIVALITDQSFLYRVFIDFRPVELLPWPFYITQSGRAQRGQGHLSVIATQFDHLSLQFALLEYFCLHLATDKVAVISILTCF